MIAVVAVVLDHLIGWPSGGFVGVDIFFVISGFLITGHLLREHDRTGSISFLGFYRRRFKRIIPAATVTLVVTVIAAGVIFTASRFAETAADAFWAFFFSANWHFALAGTDYFTADGPVSPLQHFWSLSIEEQFYFVWPWLMVGVLALHLRLGLNRRVSARIVLNSILGALTAASFIWALFETATNPTWAYFSTFSRAWELGVGALLALAATTFARIPDRARPVIAWAGIAGIIASLFVISQNSGFPAPAAALPVLATSAVIAAGVGGGQRYLLPLTNRVSGWFGDISYSLYLWHFPVIVLLAAVIPPDSVLYLIVCIVLMMALSVGSYYGVENPVRNSRLFEPRRSGVAAPPVDRTRLAIGSLVLLAAITIPLAIIAVTPKQVEGTGTVPSNELSSGGVTESRLETALTESAWPSEELSSEYLKSLQAKDINSAECFNDFTETDKSCTYNEGGGQRIAVIGDSIAMSWAPAVRAAFPEAQVTTFGKFSCPFVDIMVSTSQAPEYTSCLDYHQTIYSALAELKPNMVIVSTADYQLARLSSGADNAQSRAEWVEAMGPTLEKLAAGGADVIVLANPVPGKDLAECATKFNSPINCIDTPDGQYERMVAANELGVQAAVDDGISAVFIDSRDWFCAADGECPAIFNGEPIRSDGVHMTEHYSTMLGPNLRDAIRNAGVEVG